MNQQIRNKICLAALFFFHCDEMGNFHGCFTLNINQFHQAVSANPKQELSVAAMFSFRSRQN